VSAQPDFGPLAPTYDELRPRDDDWWELLDLMVREGGLVGRRVLDLGCGTGAVAESLDERGARVWGVDASEEMLAVARSRLPARVAVRHASAERLPFKDGWFERVVARLVVHLLDRPRAFAELARVLEVDGRAVLATMDPASFERFWLNRVFPRLAEIDRARFPDERQLVADLEGAGFRAVRVVHLAQRGELPRERALERIRGRYISTLHLLSDDEYEEGRDRAERELPPSVAYERRWLVALADR
jgi:ubiquinone/menaquinone biosynthesis C-methylase UbiE